MGKWKSWGYLGASVTQTDSRGLESSLFSVFLCPFKMSVYTFKMKSAIKDTLFSSLSGVPKIDITRLQFSFLSCLAKIQLPLFRIPFICFLSFNISSKGEFLRQGDIDSFCLCLFMIGFPMSFNDTWCSAKMPQESSSVGFCRVTVHVGSQVYSGLTPVCVSLQAVASSLPSSTLHTLSLQIG